MADTRIQREVEDWVRLSWMPVHFGQPFFREQVLLTTGGAHDFDAVSVDKTMVAIISTSGDRTANGKAGMGKRWKLRSDMLWLMQANPPRALVILTEQDMFAYCERERDNGRLPTEIEVLLALLPEGLAHKLVTARKAASDEVSPTKDVTITS